MSTRVGARDVRLCLCCAAAGLVEVGLYFSYRAHDARFHWLTHFLVGGSAALVGMAAYAWVRRRPARLPLVWIVAAHLFAMFPDFLFEGGIAHERWMDVFLGHISTHFVPGRNLTWLVVFAVALAAYLAILDGRARTDASRKSRFRRRR